LEIAQHSRLLPWPGSKRGKPRLFVCGF